MVGRGRGGRDAATSGRPPERSERRSPRLHRADDRAARAEPIPPGRPLVGGEETRGIERDHARRRRRLARFRPRPVAVPKAGRMVDASIALLARLGGDDEIGDLVSMLA